MPVIICTACKELFYQTAKEIKQPCPFCHKPLLKKAQWGIDYGFRNNGEKFGDIKQPS